MKTVTVKFVVQDEDEADSLLNEIAEDIGNNGGFPFLSSRVEDSSEDEVEDHRRLVS